MPRVAKTPVLKNVVGPAVRKRRAALGWSQARLAAECQLVGWDISRSIVAAIEGGVRWAGDFECVLLARVLRIPTEELFPDRPPWPRLGLGDIRFR